MRIFLKAAFPCLLAVAVSLAPPLAAGRALGQEPYMAPLSREKAAAAGRQVIKEGEVLSLDRCIEIALVKQPSIAAARGTVEANQSVVGQASSNYYPQLDLNSSYLQLSNRGFSRTTTTGVQTGGSAGSVSEFTSSFQLSQDIYDFGKTSSQVRAQEFAAESSMMDLEDTTVQTVFNVKQAYFGVLKAKRDKAVAAEVVAQFEKHLEQAQALYSVGIKPRFDVISAQVDVSNAKLNLIKADNSYQIARTGLNNAMGVPGAPPYDIEDILSFNEYPITLDEALGKAYANRPDMKSLAARQRAAEQNVRFAKTGYYPVLTGSAQYGWTGVDTVSDMQDFWNVGATISFPIFSGFLTKHEVGQARANVRFLEANAETLKQSIYLDVEQAYLTLKNVASQIPAAQLVVEQAQENLDIVNGRYTAGLANPIEVTDAEVSLSDAKNAYIQALFDYHVAQATLELAMGLR
jgi:outer membrane protein